MGYLTKAGLFICSFLVMSGCAQAADLEQEISFSSGYGVFLSVGEDKIMKVSEGYETVAADPQYLSADTIAAMQERGQKVYGYLNIGSLETFRPYYAEYEHLVLGPYRNWEEEYWVDAAQPEWQEFITGILAPELAEKGMDGFWVDNADVYSHFPEQETFAGVEYILKKLMASGKEVIINGGNEFVERYLQQNGQIDDILTGVNQESVFSAIDFDNQMFGRQTDENHVYYLNYLNAVDEAGKEVFLLEYTTDIQLIQETQLYSEEKGWQYFVSNSIELDGKQEKESGAD